MARKLDSPGFATGIEPAKHGSQDPRGPLTMNRTIYYLGMFGGFALAAVVLTYKPDTRYVHSLHIIINRSHYIASLPALCWIIHFS